MGFCLIFSKPYMVSWRAHVYKLFPSPTTAATTTTTRGTNRPAGLRPQVKRGGEDSKGENKKEKRHLLQRTDAHGFPGRSKKSGKRNAKKKCCCLLPPKAAEKDFFTCLTSHRGNGICKKEREIILHELIVMLVFRQNT